MTSLFWSSMLTSTIWELMKFSVEQTSTTVTWFHRKKDMYFYYISLICKFSYSPRLSLFDLLNCNYISKMNISHFTCARSNCLISFIVSRETHRFISSVISRFNATVLYFLWNNRCTYFIHISQITNLYKFHIFLHFLQITSSCTF